jgi:hypothetical protein
MARLTIKTYKRPDDDWVLAISPYMQNHFTQEEIEKVIEPSEEVLSAVPGLIKDLSQNRFEDNVYVSVRYYENKENIDNLFNILKTNEVYLERKQLIMDKLSDLGIVYRTEYIVD